MTSPAYHGKAAFDATVIAKIGAARSNGSTRWPLARYAWRAVRGIDLPPDPGNT
jgi:hypothetical protein